MNEIMNLRRILGALSLLALEFSLPAAERGLAKVNVDHMLPACCLAGSRVDQQAIGGFGSSDNAPQKIATANLGRDGQLALVAFPEQIVPIANQQQGMRLRLVNRTRREAVFPASDSRVSIVQEAKDAKGRWRPIEYLPASWCGNSDHRVFLPAGHYWEFAVPIYSGTSKTKLRFVLQGKPSLYSNEFEGSINPGQFTRRAEQRKTDPHRLNDE